MTFKEMKKDNFHIVWLKDRHFGNIVKIFQGDTEINNCETRDNNLALRNYENAVRILERGLK